MTSSPSSRVSRDRIVRDLRQAARKGDRAALTLAVAQMRTLALSPRYWERYLALLRNPLARLVDLLVIKQGERIAHQKGWKLVGTGGAAGAAPEPAAARPGARAARPGRTPHASRGRPAGRGGARTLPGSPPGPPAFQRSLFD